MVSERCFVLSLIPYWTILRYSALLENWLCFMFIHTHANLCTSKYWPILWASFEILMWINIALWRYRPFIIASDKSHFIFVCIKIVLTWIHLLLRQYGPVKTSSGPKFDYCWLLHSHTFKGLGNPIHIESSPYVQNILAYGWTLSRH